MNTTFELNNIRRDSDIFDNKFNKNSPIVEVFSAMVNGESLDKFGAKGDKAVAYIKELGERAEKGDTIAAVELNELRRFILEEPVLEAAKLFSTFGNYTAVGMNDTVEREVYTLVGEAAREQANNGDVPFPVTYKNKYPVPTTTISGGYAVDYRRVALGDMSHENTGINLVKTIIFNKAQNYVLKTIYNAIHGLSATDPDKNIHEASTLTKAGVDGVLTKVRRHGRPTIFADYAVLSQFTAWAGYVGSISSKDVIGISQKVLDELAANGILSVYNGAILSEIRNPYDHYQLNAAGTDYNTLLPAGLAVVVPAGVDSPVATWTRGGLTSFTGNDVKTGTVMTRFDLEVAADVAKGREHELGLIYDSTIAGV